MGLYPYNHKLGQVIQTNVDGVSCDRSFLAHFQVSATNAVAASTTGVHAAMNLGAAVQSITTGITSPAVPRNIQIDGNVSGITGVVKITGTNYAGATITEEITANGTSAKEGNKAFKTVTKIDLPIQNHAAVLQVETATAIGTVSTTGNASVTVTSALFEENEIVAVPVVENDDASAIALAIRTALAENEVVATHFTVSGADAAIILTAKVAADNDTTLNIAIADGEGEGASVGVTTAATSTNTTPGVVADSISVGWGDKLGLPYLLTHNTVLNAYLNNVLEGTAPAVTTSVTAIESNTIDLHSDLDGHVVDAYLIV